MIKQLYATIDLVSSYEFNELRGRDVCDKELFDKEEHDSERIVEKWISIKATLCPLSVHFIFSHLTLQP